MIIAIINWPELNATIVRPGEIENEVVDFEEPTFKSLKARMWTLGYGVGDAFNPTVPLIDVVPLFEPTVVQTDPGANPFTKDRSTRDPLDVKP